MHSEYRWRTCCLQTYTVATLVVFWLTSREIRSNVEFSSDWSSSSRVGNFFLSHSITESIKDRVEYFVDPFTHHLLKRDDEARDLRSACFDFSGNGSKQVKCIPSFSVAGMPKSGTSALYFYLKHHPQLALMSKELCALETPTNALSASLHVSYFEGLLPLESVCKDCLVGEGCIGLGARDASAYQFAIPSISTIFLLLRHPVKHKYASYWFWCTPEEIRSHIGQCGLGRSNWNTRQNITYVDANNITQWHKFPR